MGGNKMSDNEIRRILAERKRQERKEQRREAAIEAAEDIIAWCSLFGIAFMMSVIGG